MNIPPSSIVMSAFALSIFGTGYFYFTTRHKERMTILNKGLPADFFKGYSNYLPFLIILGILSFGIALGVLVGVYVESLQLDIISEIAFPFSIFIFSGISFLISYYVLLKLQKKKG